MQAHLVANQLGRQEVAFKHLTNGKDNHHNAKIKTDAKLRQCHPDPNGKTGNHPEIGHKRYKPGHKPDDKAKLKPRNRKAKPVKQPQQQTNGRLPTDKPGKRIINVARTLANIIGRLAWQIPVDLRNDSIPIAQQIKRHNRGNEQQADKVQQRQTARQHVGQNIANPFKRVGGLPLDRIRNTLQGFGRKPVQNILQIRPDIGLQRIDIARQPFKEPGQLAADHRHDQQNDNQEHQKEDGGNNAGGKCAANAARFQLIGQRIKEIGNRHPCDKRQKDARKQPHQEKEPDGAKQPKTRLLAKCHVWSSPVMRLPSKRPQKPQRPKPSLSSPSLKSKVKPQRPRHRPSYDACP